MRIKKLHPNAKLPTRATEGSSGYDLYSPITVSITPRSNRKIALGFAIEIPYGIEGQIRPRSGLANKGILPAFGTVDSDYRGEVAVNIFNYFDYYYTINVGERIAQLVFVGIVHRDLRFIDDGEELSSTARGFGGFGSTGK